MSHIILERNAVPVGDRISGGKTKEIFEDPASNNLAIVRHKAQITAGDGAKKDPLADKDIYANQTTSNIFTFLNSREIPTHFIKRLSLNEMLVEKCDMIPFEVVIRHIAFGSYLDRNPYVEEGTIFKAPVIEFFFKKDELHDPYIRFYKDNYPHIRICYELHDPHKPIIEGQGYSPIGGKFPASIHLCRKIKKEKDIQEMEEIAKMVFLELEEVWQEQDIVLVDLKIEFGISRSSGQLVVADVIDNDSWRIWPGGDKTKMLDKEVYRRSQKPQKDMKKIGENYAKVSQLTCKFLSPSL